MKLDIKGSAKIRVRLMYITGFYEISLCPAANNNNNV